MLSLVGRKNNCKKLQLFNLEISGLRLRHLHLRVPASPDVAGGQQPKRLARQQALHLPPLYDVRVRDLARHYDRDARVRRRMVSML